MIRRASNVCKSYAADAICREALGICRRITLGKAPHIAKLLRVVGVIRHRKGDLAEAETLLREALDEQRRMLGNDHPLVAECLYSLAEVLLDAARFFDAETLARECLDIRRRVLHLTHPRIATADAFVSRCGPEGGP
ncbi:MAG: tetratricopeptide repeat protein [Planctomycetota bacterium]|nr:tetratricopeptide repeat protein [Planctomycetota bacterium]